MTEKRYISMLLLLLLAYGVVKAQHDVVPAGGGVTNSSGSLEVTYGQVTCDYATNTGGRYYVGQGVQQPFCPTVYDTIYDEVCQGSRFQRGVFDLTGDSTRTAGVVNYYRHHIEGGCDTVTTLVLTVHPTYYMTEPVVACDYYEYGDSVLRESGNVKRTALSQYGCDSIDDFQLTIVHSSVSRQTALFRNPTYWNGNTYTEAGIYSDTLRGVASNGCDSIVMLVLEEGQFAAPVIYCFSNRLLMVDHYPNGEDGERVDYLAYRWYHSDNPIPQANRDNYYEYRMGSYQTLTGCYYVEVPADRGFNEWLRSNVLCIMDNVAAMPLTLGLYPNPATAGGIVTAEVSEVAHGGTLNVFDAYGRMLCSTAVESSSFVIPMRFAAGTYTVQLKSPEGESVSKKLVVR